MTVPALLLTLLRWGERSRQRRRLRAMASDAHFLGDVGISRSEALREAGKPFWRD